MVCGETTDFCNIAKNLQQHIDQSFFVSQNREAVGKITSINGFFSDEMIHIICIRTMFWLVPCPFFN
jgi:hypothetical protein